MRNKLVCMVMLCAAHQLFGPPEAVFNRGNNDAGARRQSSVEGAKPPLPPKPVFLKSLTSQKSDRSINSQGKTPPNVAPKPQIAQPSKASTTAKTPPPVAPKPKLKSRVIVPFANKIRVKSPGLDAKMTDAKLSDEDKVQLEKDIASDKQTIDVGNELISLLEKKGELLKIEINLANKESLGLSRAQRQTAVAQGLISFFGRGNKIPDDPAPVIMDRINVIKDRYVQNLAYLRTSDLQTLGLPVDAKLDQINKAYRTLSSDLHPDRNGGVMLDQFLSIQKAHARLLDSNASKPKKVKPPVAPKPKLKSDQAIVPFVDKTRVKAPELDAKMTDAQLSELTDFVQGDFKEMFQYIKTVDQAVIDIENIMNTFKTYEPFTAEGRAAGEKLDQIYNDLAIREDATAEEALQEVKALSVELKKERDTTLAQLQAIRASDLQTLGLSKDVTSTQIKKEYLRLSSKLHPDKGGDEDAFVVVNKAYTRLQNPSFNPATYASM